MKDRKIFPEITTTGTVSWCIVEDYGVFGRLHNPTSPALLWSNGERWYINGHRVNPGTRINYHTGFLVDEE